MTPRCELGPRSTAAVPLGLVVDFCSFGGETDHGVKRLRFARRPLKIRDV